MVPFGQRVVSSMRAEAGAAMKPEELFAKFAEMVATPMYPRSASDKEYFAQDWVTDRLEELGYPYQISGRNTYPDFWVGEGEDAFGVEVKSLAFANNRPARSDFDTNSTIPGGEKAGREVYTAFFLYTGSGAEPRTIHSLCFLHGDFLNAERDLVHENKAVHGFGSYGDAFIRDRKMYVFKTPFTIWPDLLGALTLVVPGGHEITATTLSLELVATVDRHWADERVIGYRADLVSNVVKPLTERSLRVGQIARFDVYASAGSVTRGLGEPPQRSSPRSSPPRPRR